VSREREKRRESKASKSPSLAVKEIRISPLNEKPSPGQYLYKKL